MKEVVSSNLTRSTKTFPPHRRADGSSGILKDRMFIERTGRIEQLDCSSDVDFWQLQGDEAIVRAALEMAVEYHVYQLGDRPVSDWRDLLSELETGHVR